MACWKIQRKISSEVTAIAAADSSDAEHIDEHENSIYPQQSGLTESVNCSRSDSSDDSDKKSTIECSSDTNVLSKCDHDMTAPRGSTLILSQELNSWATKTSVRIGL